MARIEYDEFLLKIRRDGEIEAELRPQKDNKAWKSGKLDLNEQVQKYVCDDIRRLREGDLDAKRLALLGENLYKTLFPSEIGTLFEQAVEAVRNQNDKRLRVSIDVDPKCKKIADWPLEFLCTPNGLWLATSKNITLSRRLRFEKGKIHPPDKSPLKVLVVASKPQGLGGVMTAQTLEDIAKWTDVKEGKEQTRIDVKLLGLVEKFEQAVPGVKYLNEPATFNNLGVWTRHWSPHVLHFIGHGQLKENEPSLALVKDMRENDWCSSTDFASLFADWRPRLVVLQACESAMPATGSGFMSLAAHLVKQNIPAVVAMQFEIRNDCATGFATGFYKALAQGLEVDAAVQDGRWAISYGLNLRWKVRDFGAPVLFMGCPDRII